MTTTRPGEVIEGVQIQRDDEEVIYSIDISEWGGNPANIGVVVTNQDNTDVTSTVMPGTPVAFSSTVIKLPVLKSLTAGNEYRVSVEFETGDGQVLSGWFAVRAEAR
jgi:hypothetical protein